MTSEPESLARRNSAHIITSFLNATANIFVDKNFSLMKLR